MSTGVGSEIERLDDHREENSAYEMSGELFKFGARERDREVLLGSNIREDDLCALEVHSK